LMLAFSIAQRIGHTSRSPEPGAHRHFLVGLWTGLAVICELQAAVPAAFIVILALLNARDADRRTWVAASLRVLAGGLVFGFLFFAYNTLAFGSPFHIGYASEEGFVQLRSGFFGISYPE